MPQKFRICISFDFSRPWLWLCSIWLSCLRLCWFYILHIPWRQTECPLSPCLECVFSYAFTENSCGWQLVQNSSSATVSSSFQISIFVFCSTFFFYFKVEKLVKRQIVVCESQGRVLISLCASDSQWKPFKSIDSEVKKTTRRRKSHRVAACRVCFANGKSTEFLSRT